MELLQRTRFLRSLFTFERRVVLEDAPVEIRPCLFVETIGEREMNDLQAGGPGGDFCSTPDNRIEENKRFSYAVFLPGGTTRGDRAILLLHGLNERSWDKYLPWAEYLSLATGKAVILFPIAFHMNRAPACWRDPRALQPLVALRKQGGDGTRNSTFVNVAISARLSAKPERFYLSGRESLFNLWQLFSEIRDGRHSLFKEGASIDIFAYSIGALLAQVLLLSDPGRLTRDSRLFMFCGGALFSYMDGSARDIVDQEAYARVRSFYTNEFLATARGEGDRFEKAFKAMILPRVSRAYREAFFERASERVRVVTLKNDSVMPTPGAREAVGERLAGSLVEELDFPFPYSHQHPFPVNDRVDPGLVHRAFESLFQRVAGFLG
ncbi:MAG: DUF6051 family protein [Odoribacteraceae bacterium]|jgi:pimeloyl-ACP methyl ester carboxylesterase|nr:DUF6051 family protein [Odoribacteraceae bacterium]